MTTGLRFLLTLALATPSGVDAVVPGLCMAEGPEYYAFELVTTRNIPGTGLATGTAQVTVARGSPFSVAVTSDGSYEYDVHISLERLNVPTQGRFVAWITTRELDQTVRVGPLDSNLQASGHVVWNKFLVVITLEPGDDADQMMWTGPIVFRGMSRSGMMHTMAGHGAFQKDNCAIYGYGN